MASSSGIRAGKAYIELSMNDSKLKAGLVAAQRRLTSFGAGLSKIGGAITGLGTAVAAPIAALAKEFASYGDNIQKAAIRTGLTTEALSELAFAAQQSGTDMSTLERGIAGMQRQLLSANLESKDAADAFAAIGVSLEEINKLSVEDQFLAIADGIAGINNDSERAALAMRIFGKSGQKLLPLLSDGAKGVAALRKEAQSLGLSISQEDADAAAALTDAFGRFTSTFKAARIQIGSAVAGVLTPFFTTTAKIVSNLVDWAKENRAVVRTVFLVAAGVAALGAAVAGLGAFFILAGAAIGGLIAAFTAVAGAIAFVLSPLGLFIAGITAVGVAIVKSLGGVGGIVELLKERFGGLFSEFARVFDAIKQTLGAGDVEGAANVLWASLQVIWSRGVLELNKQWVKWGTFFKGVYDSALTGFLSVFTNVIATAQTYWVETWGFMKDAFDLVITGVKSGFLTLGEVILGLLERIAAAFDFLFETQLAQSIEGARKKLETLNADVNDSFIERVGERDKERRGQLADIEARRRAALDKIEADSRRRREGQQVDTSGIEAAQQRLEDARRKYEEILGKIETEGPKQAGAGLTDFLDKFKDAIGGAEVASSSAPSTQSQFGGSRASQVFGNLANEQLAVAKRQLQKQQEVVEETKKTRKAIQAGGLAFGS